MNGGSARFRSFGRVNSWGSRTWLRQKARTEGEEPLAGEKNTRPQPAVCNRAVCNRKRNTRTNTEQENAMATQLTSAVIQRHEVVSPNEWIASRKELLRKEKEFTKLRDELSRQRRELPWEKVEKQYVFDGPNGKVTLADVFDGQNQLIVYHFMFGPGWEEGCPSCSFVADHFDGSLVHLSNRDVTLVVVSRAPLAQIEAFKKRMGWRFHWVSSFANDFNRDYHVSFSKDETASGKAAYNFGTQNFSSEEGPGLSVFYKNDKGEIFHTYSTYARGLDILITAYNFLDMTPK